MLFPRAINIYLSICTFLISELLMQKFYNNSRLLAGSRRRTPMQLLLNASKALWIVIFSSRSFFYFTTCKEPSSISRFLLFAWDFYNSFYSNQTFLGKTSQKSKNSLCDQFTIRMRYKKVSIFEVKFLKIYDLFALEKGKRNLNFLSILTILINLNAIKFISKRKTLFEAHPV